MARSHRLLEIPHAGVAAVALAALLLVACSPAIEEPPLRPATGQATDRDVVATFEEVPLLHPSVDGYPAGTVEVVGEDSTAHHVAVRVATSSDQRAHGLMEVPELPAGAGMWFVYETDRTGGFWMKNTLVPLDIAYVGADGRIVSIADAVPCRNDPCPSYHPGSPYRHVLEVPAGYLDDIGAGVGSTARRVDG